MSVTHVSNRIQYVGDGSTVKFSFPQDWLIDPNDSNKPLVDSGGDIQVWEEATGATSSTQRLTGFTAYGPGDPTNPSSVIYSVAPASGTVVTIIRIMPLTQSARFIPSQPLSASVVEEALDKLTMICQQLQEQINRATVVDISVTNAAPYALPKPIANDYLRWDPTASFLIDDPGPTVTTVSGGSWPFRIVFDTADPVAGGFAPSHYAGMSGTTWNVGDTCYNTAPALDGWEGWICTTSGTSVTAVFAPFGQISSSKQ